MDIRKSEAFRSDLIKIINMHSMESLSNTPDFILAQVMTEAMYAFGLAVRAREKWYGVENAPGARNTDL